VTIPQPISLRQDSIRQLGYDRTFGDRAFQIQFSTTNLEMRSAVGLNVYPILTPSTAAKGRRLFKEDIVLMGCYLSVTFISVAAAETCCVAIARNSPNRLSALGDANTFLQATLDNAAAGPAGSLIQRNVGSMFAPPFLPLIQQSNGLQLFGSDQTAAEWYCLATIYYVRLQDYARLMQA
jgi:hypothetical protein